MAKYTKKTENNETIDKAQQIVEDKIDKVEKVEKIEKTEKVEKKQSTKVNKSKKSFEPSDTISCRSVVTGQLFLEGYKTKMPYQWTDYGDVIDVEYRDLQALVQQKSGYIFNPFFIIDDDDFVAEFPYLQKFYEQNYSIKELNEILRHPVEQMVKEISTLPNSAVETLKKIASNQVSLGQIDSVKKIKALDEIFDTDLNLLSELMN